MVRARIVAFGRGSLHTESAQMDSDATVQSPRTAPRCVLVVLVAAALVTVSARGAHAQGAAPVEDVAAARAAFERGVAALDESRFVDAVEAFRESYRLRPRPVVLNNLALAYRGVGRYREAIESFESYLRERGARLTPQETAQTRREIERLRSEMPRIVLRVEPADALVLLDGDPVATASGDEIAVDPGAHVFEVSREGYQVLTRSFAAHPRDRTSFALTLHRAAGGVGIPTARGGQTLRVLVSEPSARVFIDRELVGTGPVEREISAGAHQVAVRLDGFLPIDRRVSVESGHSETLTVRMVPAVPRPGLDELPPGVRAAERPLAPWVVPVAVAAGAVAAGVIAVSIWGIVAAGAPESFPQGSWGVLRER